MCDRRGCVGSKENTHETKLSYYDIKEKNIDISLLRNQILV